MLNRKIMGILGGTTAAGVFWMRRWRNHRRRTLTSRLRQMRTGTMLVMAGITTRWKGIRRSLTKSWEKFDPKVLRHLRMCPQTPASSFKARSRNVKGDSVLFHKSEKPPTLPLLGQPATAMSHVREPTSQSLRNKTTSTSG